jgi:transposase
VSSLFFGLSQNPQSHRDPGLSLFLNNPVCFNDCPLVTLGLVLDMQGFPKKSRIFEGNISEPKTLEMMIKGLASEHIDKNSVFKPTIVLDAGIATQDNIKWLKDELYHYIVFSRKKKND